MSFRLRIVDSVATLTDQVSNNKKIDSPAHRCWDTNIYTDTCTAQLCISDPFLLESAENDVKWFLENYAANPFEEVKAEYGQELLTDYGRNLAVQVANTGLVPKQGDIHLEIESQQQVTGVKTIHHLHWEILEDPKLWPAGYNLGNITVVRHITGNKEVPSLATTALKTFRILLVVSRLGKQDDADHQIVSLLVVAIIDHIRQTSPQLDISLMILRPPTWDEFQAELQRHKYDLVHFDMKGRIRKSKTHTGAVLEFVKPHHIDSLAMLKDYRNGNEIGQALSSANVKTVVLNACESAGFDSTSQEANLAQILLQHGVNHVFAMSYKIMEEAVEICMNAFYQSLLVGNTSLPEAASRARRALINNKQRRAKHMYNVQILDYIVPTFYTNSSSMVVVSLVTPPTTTIPLPTTLESKSLHRTLMNPYIANNQFLIGRDTDILSLEYLLYTSRLVLLHGQGGCGKTEFVGHVGRWWKASGWILGTAYIDLGRDLSLDWKDVIDQISTQFSIPSDKRSEAAIVHIMNSGRYLLVLDNADALDSPLSIQLPFRVDQLISALKPFIHQVTRNNQSMVIISSRLSSTQIANITSERQKFQLHGLSILESVELLQQCVFSEALPPPPKECYHPEDIDFLRRTAILLEGNPTAIQLVAPEFRRVGYRGEELFNSTLYGVIDDISLGEYTKSRFCVSVSAAIYFESFVDYNETLIGAIHFACFWTVMPRDLTTFYWFFYLAISKYFVEGTYLNWVSPQLQAYMKDGQMAHKLQKYWPEIETKLIAVGILTHATITCSDGTKQPCYHVNPVYTLFARSCCTGPMWKEAKFAYIRQSLLWNVPVQIGDNPATSEWESIEWDGIEQHNDHIHNGYIQALGWALDEGDPQEQTKRSGMSLFYVAYRETVASWWSRPRPARLIVPHLRQHLLYYHMVVEFLHPDKIPTTSDLGPILTCSWALYQLESSNTMQTTKGPIVKHALEATDRWKKAAASSRSVSAGTEPTTEATVPLLAPLELKWFQLCFAEANLMVNAQYIKEAKELFERNLSTDPVTSDPGLVSIIRRWQMQNLFGWARCVGRIALKDGRFSEKDEKHLYQVYSKGWKEKGICKTLTDDLANEPQAFEALKTSDLLGVALEIESDAVSKFSKLATEIINSPFLNVFSDIQERTGESYGDWLKRLLATKEVPQVDADEVISQFEELESYYHMMAGDPEAAMKAISGAMRRESPSSTTSPGWERLAELHMYQYSIAISSKEAPDYKRGLRHLLEWHKLHKGVGIWKQDYVWGLMKLGECYSELGRVVDAGRELIKCVQVGQTLRPEDCMDSDANAARELIQLHVTRVKCLDIFLDSNVVLSVSPKLGDLSLKERVQLYQIVTAAHAFKNDRDEAFRIVQEQMDLINRIEALKVEEGWGQESSFTELDPTARKCIISAMEVLAYRRLKNEAAAENM